jgi:hypothetical protein
MQVFTTIYLAETLRADVDGAEKNESSDPQFQAVVELTRTLREHIAKLENRGIHETENYDD